MYLFILGVLIFKLILFVLKWLLIALLALPFILIGFSVNDIALVTGELKPSHYDIARVDKILKRHNPRDLKQGETGHLALSEQDIDALLITSLSPFKKAAAKTWLHDKEVEVAVSINLPENKYANISLNLIETPRKLLAIEQLRFGSLSIPSWALEPFWDLAQRYFYQFEEYQRLLGSVQTIQITPKQLIVSYTADWEAIGQLKQRGLNLVISDAETSRVQSYQNQLIQTINDLANKNSKILLYESETSLSVILKTMFQFALKRSSPPAKQSDRSQADKASAVDENKALLFVLAMHVGGKNIEALLGKSTIGQSAVKNTPKITLRQRRDLAQHFSISAFLAAAAGDDLAQATGLFKEVSDSKGGSGFSFADLAADQAGVAFGTMAVASETSAYSLQVYMAQIINENDYMPEIGNLPEGLQEIIFKKRYGSTEDIRYTKMQDELDRRMNNCRLYKDRK